MLVVKQSLRVRGAGEDCVKAEARSASELDSSERRREKQRLTRAVLNLMPRIIAQLARLRVGRQPLGREGPELGCRVVPSKRVGVAVGPRGVLDLGDLVLEVFDLALELVLAVDFGFDKGFELREGTI